MPAPPITSSQALWRRVCIAGAVAVGVVDFGLSALAYVGVLPAWMPTQNGGDKLGHLVMFGALSFFLDGALGYRAIARRAPAFAHLGPVALWSVVAVDEWAQRFSPVRSSELADLVADTVGIVGFAALSTYVDAWLGRRGEAGAVAPIGQGSASGSPSP